MKKFILYIIIVVLASGCNLYRKFPKTKDVSESLYGNEYITTDTTTIASLSWKSLFTDTVLQRLIDTALVRNTDLRTARLRTRQAEAELLNTTLSYLPSVNLVAEGSVAGTNNSTSTTYNLGASASWELDIFGKVTNARRRDKEALEASRAYELAVQSSLISAVASAYYTLLTLDARLEIDNETLVNWERSIRVLEALKQRGGKITEAAVLQAKANYLSLQSQVLSTEGSIKNAENAICTLLSVEPSSVVRGKLEEQEFPSTLHTGIPLQLLSNRPDVMVAEHEMAKKFYSANVARAAFYPSINLLGSLGWTNNTGNVCLNPAGMLFNAVGSIVQPLFNKGTNIANLRVATAEQEIAVLKFQQTLLDAGIEVNNALSAWQNAQKKLDIDVSQVVTLQETVRKTELLMLHTSANYLEVLTAQQGLLTARQAVVKDKADIIYGVISLYHALGGGVR